MYGTRQLAFAAWDPETSTVCPQFPETTECVGFDAHKVASGCMHAVLCRHCDRLQLDSSVGEAVVNMVDIQDNWRDIFPGPQFWDECACMNEQERIEWTDKLMLESCRGLALPQVTDSGTELRVLFKTRLDPSAQKRFERLFNVKPTWTKDEIEPYLDIHDRDCHSPTELLLRYSRLIRDGAADAPVYCAR